MEEAAALGKTESDHNAGYMQHHMIFAMFWVRAVCRCTSYMTLQMCKMYVWRVRVRVRDACVHGTSLPFVRVFEPASCARGCGVTRSVRVPMSVTC